MGLKLSAKVHDLAIDIPDLSQQGLCRSLGPLRTSL